MSMRPIIDIADSLIMLPLASAIGASLLAGRAWKLAACWCAMFGVGLSLVALSKILYIGWGTELQSLHFRALSGHAWRATAVLPVVSFFVLQKASRRWRVAGVALGVLLSLFIGVLLVRFRLHTSSEVIASAILGNLVGLGFIRLASMSPTPRIDGQVAAVGVLAVIVALAFRPPSLSRHLVDIALYLSDNKQPHTWSEHKAGRAARPVPVGGNKTASHQGASGADARAPLN